MIDELFNGFQPWTDKEAEENQIQVNVNWGEGADLLLQARQQYENAILTTGNYWTIRVPDAPQSKRDQIGADLTRLSNNPFKRGRGARNYMHTQRQKFSSVALHGPGAQMWEDKEKPYPYFVGIADLLIPTNTDITLEDMCYFDTRWRMSPGKLFRKTLAKGKNVDPGWQLDLVKDILNSYRDLNQNPNNYNWYQNPEEMVHLWKQNILYYESDSVPKVWLHSFFYQEDESERPCWYRVVMLDRDSPNQTEVIKKPRFLYQSKVPFGETIDQIIQIQFSDGNNVPPFTYHECRGLGVRLFDVVSMMNRTRCQWTQKVWEDMMLLFHVTDPADKGRLQQIFMGMMYGVIPDGLNMVRREERYTPDANMVEGLLANFKQLMGEGSQAYTQDIDDGTQKERTAFEVNALLQQSTKLTGSMLNLAYLQETFAYEEICRRLALKGTHDFTALKFQNDCKEAGIPEKWMDSTRWQVEPERVLGNGNSQIEQAQAQQLWNIREALNPEAQAKVANKYVFAITHDPKVTEELAPRDAQPHVTKTIHDTELVFAALMNGTKITPVAEVNGMEVVSTMVGKIQESVQQILQTGGMGTPQQVMGLQLAAQYTGFYLQQLSMDETKKQFVKQWGDLLGKAMNEVKGFAQRQQQMMKARQNGNGQMDPAKAQELQAKQAADQQKLQQKDQTHKQRLAHKQQDFQASMQQKRLTTLADISTKAAVGAAQANAAKKKSVTEE